jgi:amino acid adenylation domain-containing protein
MGVGPESAVGLHFERSTDLAVAIIGTLESGGVCVPLELSLPAQRLRGMIEDAAVKIVLSDRDLADQAAARDCRVVRIEEMAEEVTPPAVSADNAAFIFFTSGSTGRPNAVVVTHRAAASGQCPETGAIRLQPGDCLLLTAPISSARLLGELFWPLFAGAQVCMARPDGHQDYRYLLDEISRRRISVLSMVPAMLSTFLQGDMTKCASLRTVFAVGEALPDAVKASFCNGTDADLCNAYAQTEACPVTFCRARERPERPAATIGKPGANTRTYVLDASLDPVPIGAAGHLYVAGSGLARGYLGQPALTALKFVPDPFSGRPGERMYWTGDVAKYLPSGDLVSLGRNDLRVKVRGYRIELQEIETVLMEHPLVQECAVTVDVGLGGESRLTAYVVARDGVPLRANELRRVLKQKLPLHMVPASFTYLPQLPRNASGKIDRPALSQQGRGTPAQDDFVEARTPLEMHIAQAWTSVLGGHRVGMNDNFFDLGGDSLSAIEAIARIKERSGVSIRPRDMIFLSLEQIARLAQPAGQ